MARVLYDLTASQDRRFSPFCWRTKLALAHKGLEFTSQPVRFTDISGLSDGPRLTLPTLDDGDQRITDSWAIALHLEATYPDHRALFPTGQAVARFVQGWTNTTLHQPLLRIALLTVYNALDAQNQAYFRENREARFGTTLEAFVEDRPAALTGFRRALQPIRDILADQPYLAGSTPAYADYIPAGVFLWAEAVGETNLLEAGDPIAPWLQRVTAVLSGD
jgi:glutathione S-transferase